MTSELVALCFDAHEPAGLASSGRRSSGREVTDDHMTAYLPAHHDTGFRFRFLPHRPAEDRAQPDALRPDQHHPGGPGADGGPGTGPRRDGTWTRPAPGHRSLVLADPEGNEFYVIPPGNNFLAGRGPVGALSTRRIAARSATSGARPWAGRWSGTRARDRDPVTAEAGTRSRKGRSAQYSPKVEQGAGALRPGAADGQKRPRPLRGRSGCSPWVRGTPTSAPPAPGTPTATEVVLADPDGNEFCVLATGRPPDPAGRDRVPPGIRAVAQPVDR